MDGAKVQQVNAMEWCFGFSASKSLGGTAEAVRSVARKP